MFVLECATLRSGPGRLYLLPLIPYCMIPADRDLFCPSKGFTQFFQWAGRAPPTGGGKGTPSTS